MALFSNKFIKHDDYMTPFHVWEDIRKFIPNKIIWEPFYGDGKSGEYLRQLNFEVIHEPIDFFENDLGDIIVSNPPFSLIPIVLQRLKSINKPFILIMPSSKINTQYFRKLFHGDTNLQIIIPKKRIQFIKIQNGEEKKQSNANFDCMYYCWQIELDNCITWL
jgi:hypothetical protein